MKPLSDHVSGRIRLAVWVLAGAVGMVMLIVCANLSNLLLARTASRQKEIAIRTALGAGRGRLLAQMLTEGTRALEPRRGPRTCFSPRRHAGALAARRGEHPAAARRADRRHGSPVLRGGRARHRHRLRPGAGTAGARGRVDQRVEGREPRIDRGPPARVAAQRARGVGDRRRLRAAGRRRAADSQPDPGARRRHGLRRVAGARRSASIPTAVTRRSSSASRTSTRCCGG